MSQFINPFTDEGFKRIFGCEVNKDLLIHFLNQLLVGMYVIEDVTFLNKERVLEIDDNRVIIYDVFCKTDKNERIVVEMQNAPQGFFKKRSVYYISRAISDQGCSGSQWRYDIKAMIGVFFLNFAYSGDVKFKTDVMLTDLESGDVFSDVIFMTFLRLPLFRKNLDECDNDFERWTYILKNMDKLERMPNALKDAVWDKLFKVCDVSKMTREEYESYEHSLKAYNDMKSNEEYWQMESQKSRLEGIAEGKSAMARNLKELGVPTDVIMKSSGLSAEQIAAL